MSTKPKINVPEFRSEFVQIGDSPVLIEDEESGIEESIESDMQWEELKTLKEFNRTLAQNNEERKKYARLIFRLTCIWTGLIFGIMFLQGFKIMSLSDKVLIALITSTTINFFGFFLLVIKYLFNPKADSPYKNRSRLKETE